MHNEQVDLSQVLQSWFSILKPITVIYYIKRLVKKIT